MTVAELIEELKKMPQWAPVIMNRYLNENERYEDPVVELSNLRGTVVRIHG